ncbi:hypothetical protein [Endozoicomonas sp. 4G]|uniref:hypothetical protein n=1 Tax=Endozoicomonas sp. 4G TaxID=2872754 RepID=UPI0020790867|nr:hypothetical protein [Endozoicomonas sp. 4G]
MLSKKPLILTLVITFSVHGSHGHAQENHAQENHAQENHAQENHAQENHAQENHAQESNVSLLFALAVGKTLILTPKPFIEVFLMPDTRYCFSPDSGVEAKAYSRASSDEGSDSEDSSTADKNGDNHSDEMKRKPIPTLMFSMQIRHLILFEDAMKSVSILGLRY